MATADDALQCCQATNSLLNQLLAALASFQDALNALQARMDALEREIKELKEKFPPWRDTNLSDTVLPADYTPDIINALNSQLSTVKPLTPPASSGAPPGEGPPGSSGAPPPSSPPASSGAPPLV